MESPLKRLINTPKWSAVLAKNRRKPRFPGHLDALKYPDAESANARSLLGDLWLLKK